MAEKDLTLLLRHLAPVLNEGTYVFSSFQHITFENIGELLFIFREKEGITIVCLQDIAEKYNLPYEFKAAWITLDVKSDLSAVGLTAAFSNALASAGISCNVVSGFHHDHIFVDHTLAQEAIQILQTLSASYR